MLLFGIIIYIAHLEKVKSINECMCTTNLLDYGNPLHQYDIRIYLFQIFVKRAVRYWCAMWFRGKLWHSQQIDMGPKPTPSKQQNTLFSYFSKSPVIKTDDSCKSGLQDVLSPKRSPNQKSPPSKKGKDSGLSCGKLLTLCWWFTVNLVLVRTFQ